MKHFIDFFKILISPSEIFNKYIEYKKSINLLIGYSIFATIIVTLFVNRYFDSSMLNINFEEFGIDKSTVKILLLIIFAFIILVTCMAMLIGLSVFLLVISKILSKWEKVSLTLTKSMVIACFSVTPAIIGTIISAIIGTFIDLEKGVSFTSIAYYVNSDSLKIQNILQLCDIWTIWLICLLVIGFKSFTKLKIKNNLITNLLLSLIFIIAFIMVSLFV
ncbi:MAG: YIP1 family protein [Clostridiaceae bacterium]